MPILCLFIVHKMVLTPFALVKFKGKESRPSNGSIGHKWGESCESENITMLYCSTFELKY